MNEMEVEKALDALADSASATPDFLRDFPAKLMAAYQASPSQIARLIKDNDALRVKVGNGDLLSLDGNDMNFIWPKQMHYRSATIGAVHDVVDQVAASQKPKAIPGKTGPRFIVSTDGHAFAAVDLRTGDRFKGETLNDLVGEYDFLQPMFGVERYTPPVEQEADVKAARHMREIHDAIVAHDDRWGRSDHAEALNTFMIRLLFCLFADGSGVFPPKHGNEKPFGRIMNRHAMAKDGTDTKAALEKAFRVLDLPEADPRRDAKVVGGNFADLPYANGKLFQAELAVPAFNGRAQRALRRALDLDWGEINADIFGSMIQAIAGEGDRSHFGMHYTSVPNIMKVLGPLFINPLKEQLAAAGTDRRKLQALIDRIGGIHVFDPACGSGNFLIIAYRELRAIETAALAIMHGAQRLAIIVSCVRLDHFHGIDPVDFACRTARLSLWISQIQADRKLAEIGVEPPAILPLHDAGDIRQGSALNIDWKDVVPAGIGETYIVGNPPYLGAKGGAQQATHKAEMDTIFEGKLPTWRNLDYVAAWFVLAADHIAACGSQAAMVSTNSICQGEQVSALWPLIRKQNVEIGFAHTGFRWANSAAHNAGVACIIVGLRQISREPKRIYSRQSEHESTQAIAQNINSYLVDAPDVSLASKANDLPVMLGGNMAADGGGLILSPGEKTAILASNSEASSFIKRYMGSNDFLNDVERYCIWVPEDRVDEARAISSLCARFDLVERSRLASPAPTTRERASASHRFIQIQDALKPAILIPSVSSERRQYLQVGFVDADTIVSNTAFAIYNPPVWMLALLSTRMHMAWTKAVGGRLEDRIRYANRIVYDTFVPPPLDKLRRTTLEEYALRIVDARQPHLDDGRSIAWLYNPETMPDNLCAVHDELDEEFEGMYVGRRFRHDAERLGHLFRLHARMKGSTK